MAERIAMGADIVTFSGDKVLGGPQAGIIVGTKRAVDAIARNSLHRALRCSKLTFAALEATLRLYQQSADIVRDIPTLRALVRPIDEIEEMGKRVLPSLRATLGAGFEISLEDATSQIGSGALPVEEIPTKVVAIRGEGRSADWIASRFRSARPPIVGRIRDGRFLLDPRTIVDPDDAIPRWDRESPL